MFPSSSSLFTAGFIVPSLQNIVSPATTVKSNGTVDTEYEQGPLRDEYAPVAWTALRAHGKRGVEMDIRQAELRAMAQTYGTLVASAGNAIDTAEPTVLKLDVAAELESVPTPATDDAVARSALSLVDWAVDILAVLVARRVAVAGDHSNDQYVAS
jgi:hypothetical protein